ncbi:hypothetical protein RB7733 [Rhodopirellula baltica SH 1]|uniref:Uncharacterized protein n=1 Tax=Rhodopirellula baltica (strain DSM 10527 / NCIMB 13988 / SH1) TaxID=243090 RepID=Q7UN80_RHOBA|nr:hypothetical protein RB7733 [Rhodopirellula baltica SH 1]
MEVAMHRDVRHHRSNPETASWLRVETRMALLPQIREKLKKSRTSVSGVILVKRPSSLAPYHATPRIRPN